MSKNRRAAGFTKKPTGAFPWALSTSGVAKSADALLNFAGGGHSRESVAESSRRGCLSAPGQVLQIPAEVHELLLDVVALLGAAHQLRLEFIPLLDHTLKLLDLLRQSARCASMRISLRRFVSLAAKMTR